MLTRDQLTDYARTLIGMGEDPPGSNVNAVSRAYGLIGAWCAMTTWFVFHRFGVDLRREFTQGWAATTLGANAAKTKGLWRAGRAGVKRGDLVYFKIPGGDAGYVNHTGIYDSDGYTIDGNWANRCQRVKHPSSQWVGYIDMSRYYAAEPKPKPKPAVPLFPGRAAFKLGRTHSAVTALDKQLIRLGYTKSHDGDGYQAGPRFTKWTRTNVQAFQHAQGWNGADADGYPGPETWRRLFTTPTPKR